MFVQSGVLVLLVSCILAVPVKDGRVQLDGPLPPTMLQPRVEDINPVIIGSHDVDPAGKYPWQVSLQYVDKHRCGASIMNENFIITAGHCLGGMLSYYEVVAGMHNQTQKTGGTTQTVIPAQFYLHDDYMKGEGNYPNDIALIKLKTPLTFNDFVKPIPLDENGVYGPNSECVISGWGLYRNNKTGEVDFPDILQEASTALLQNADCKNYWGAQTINPGHVCILSDSSACRGDSGGPLHCRNNPSEDWHLVGITSWGSGCCTTSKPSIYTRVSYFMNWIRKTRGY